MHRVQRRGGGSSRTLGFASMTGSKTTRWELRLNLIGQNQVNEVHLRRKKTSTQEAQEEPVKVRGRVL